MAPYLSNTHGMHVIYVQWSRYQRRCVLPSSVHVPLLLESVLYFHPRYVSDNLENWRRRKTVKEMCVKRCASLPFFYILQKFPIFDSKKKFSSVHCIETVQQLSTSFPVKFSFCRKRNPDSFSDLLFVKYMATIGLFYRCSSWCN